MKVKLTTILLCMLCSTAGFAQQYGWTTLTSPTTGTLRRIYVSGSEAWLNSGSSIYYSSNYPSVQFSSIYTPASALYDMTFINKSGWAVGTSSLGARTTDGTSWKSMSLGGTSSYYCVSFPTTSLGFASGTDKRLHKTVNGGTNWTDAGVVLGFSTVTTLFFVDSDTGYVGTADPRLAKTTNGGITWLDEGEITGGIDDIYFYDTAHGWAVGTSDILYYNNGIWTRLNNTTGNSLNSVFFIDANEGWIVGNGGTILHSTNGGANWTAQSSGTSANLLDVFFTSPTNGYAVGQYGTILHYSQLTGTEEDYISEISVLEQNYPNPFKETTTIDFTLEAPSQVVLEVFSIGGEKICTLANEKKSPGNYSVPFNAKDLPAGIYYYRLQTETGTSAGKMTLIQ